MLCQEIPKLQVAESWETLPWEESLCAVLLIIVPCTVVNRHCQRQEQKGPSVWLNTAVLLFLHSYFIPATKSIFILLPGNTVSMLGIVFLGIWTSVIQGHFFPFSFCIRSLCQRFASNFPAQDLETHYKTVEQCTYGSWMLSSRHQNGITVSFKQMCKGAWHSLHFRLVFSLLREGPVCVQAWLPFILGGKRLVNIVWWHFYRPDYLITCSSLTPV